MRHNITMSLHYFSVSLANNIRTVIASHVFFSQQYPGCHFHVICPSTETDHFRANLPHKNVEVIDEENIISYSDFIEIYNLYVKQYRISNKSEKRMGWYYQQILKISFFLEKITEYGALLLWEADSLPIKKISFFNNNQPISYGSLMEFHRPYFATKNTIFKTLPSCYYACTNNFIAASKYEIHHLTKFLHNYFPNSQNLPTGHWISHIVLRSVLDTHKDFTHSEFSEQELIGLATLLYKNQRQYPIRQVRWGLTGILNQNQISLAKLFGFSYISYEQRQLLNEAPQHWIKLIKILLEQRWTQRKILNSKVPIKMQLALLASRLVKP
jgi:hypothetical protein